MLTEGHAWPEEKCVQLVRNISKLEKGYAKRNLGAAIPIGRYNPSFPVKPNHL